MRTFVTYVMRTTTAQPYRQSRDQHLVCYAAIGNCRIKAVTGGMQNRTIREADHARVMMPSFCPPDTIVSRKIQNAGLNGHATDGQIVITIKNRLWMA